MININNIKLFKISLNNPEPIIDDFYLRNENLIISKDIKNPTDVMKKNSELLENISAYNFGEKNNNPSTSEKAIKNILQIVRNKNINYSEFVSFWPVVDVSYSLFSKLDEKNQIKIIKNIVEKYIELRHNLYSIYGYTPTTLQTGKDAKTHKGGGNLGINKIASILIEFGFKKANTESMERFISVGNKKFIETDKKGKKLFKTLLSKYKIKFFWSEKKEKKMPDVLIKYEDHIFIIEHKHKKEGGGGQNSQINEIISLISFRENNPKIHYVSFLDGIYFNLFTDERYLNKGKILEQLKKIEYNLRRNKQNYFVNTAGFRELFSQLK